MRGNTVVGCEDILRDDVAGTNRKAHAVADSLVLCTGLSNGRNTVQGKHQII